MTRDLPAIDDTRRALIRALRPEESFMMKLRSTVRRRPWLVPSVAAAVVMLLSLIPVSYQITSGYTVRLRLDVPRTELGTIAADFGRALGTDHVAISFQGAGSELLARVSSDDSDVTERAARTFAASLSSRGVSAELSLSPVRALVTSPLYAAGLGGIRQLDIRRSGRSAADVERDLQDQLRSAGVNDARVTFTEQDGCSMVQIVANGGACKPFGAGGDGIDVALVCSSEDKNCTKSCETACSSSACRTNGSLEVTVDGRKTGFVCTAEARLESTSGMSDAEIAAALVDRLKGQGVEAEVVVQGGDVVSVNPVCKTK